MPLRGEIDKVYSSAVALTEEKLAEEIALAVSEAELPPVEISEEHIVDLRTLKREEAAVKENVKSEEKEILTPSAVNQAEPIIIHKEESARPILGAKRSLGGLFGFLRGEKEAEPKAVEAKIEIGRTAEEMSKEIPEPPKLKVVHYSEFKTPVADSLSKTDDKREELPVPVSPKPISSVLPKTALDILEIEPPVESPAQVAAKVFEKAPEKAPETPLLPPKPPIPPKPPVPPQEPKFEIKKGEEVIDLRTMQKISNIKNQNAK